MRRLFTLLLIVCAWLCIPQKVAAEEVYLLTAQNLNGVTGNYNVPSNHIMNYVSGSVYKLEINSCASSTFNFRIGVQSWKDKYIAPTSNDKSLSIDSESSAGETTPTANAQDWTHYSSTNNTWVVTFDNNLYKNLTIYVDISESNKKVWVVGNSTGISYTDTEFEMVAEYGGKSLILPLSCARHRDQDFEGSDKSKMSTTLFTVGFKDELLPGENNDNVKVYVRGKNNHNAQFRPSTNGSSLGGKYALLNNTSLTDLRNDTYITGAAAASSDNTFIIKKGSGVSYTVGLNLGSQITETSTQTLTPYEYTIKAKSLTLYTNKSLDEFYSGKYSTYKNKSGNNLTKKENLEDYYLFGTIYGTTADDSQKGGYMYSEDGKWGATIDGYAVSNFFKMEKQVYLNPNDKSKVDSIVYSKAIARPSSKTYQNMYMTFAPKSLIDGSGSFGYNTFYDACKWNYVVRPEVFSQKDGTAVKGSVFVSGVTDNSKRNGEQSLNPQVNDNKDHYIIRLNTTTSTYRVEFVNAEPVIIKSNGIRTFVSRFNYRMPKDAGVAAYAVQSFTPSTNKELNGQPNGTVNLRRLKFIPANEPVVLIYNTKYEASRQNPSENADSVTLSLEEITGGANDPDGFLELETQEDWWMKDYSKDEDNDYNNLLVGVLDDEVIENGKYRMVGNKYHYDYRHFALNLFSKTKYYKDNKLTSGDYIGFFRARGKVPAGNAYLRLTDEDLNFDGQILGDIDSGLDLKPSETAPSKFSFAFDIEPWDDVTAIQEVKTETRQDDAYYTLQGVKVAHPTKGIYIHNGKKMILK